MTLLSKNDADDEELVAECEDLDRALAALPEDNRFVVVLADVEGLKYGEIADVLDVPIGALMQRLSALSSDEVPQKARELQAQCCPTVSPGKNGQS
jgi:DNA-directed RNA polymerase specialized sigma24 family protein